MKTASDKNIKIIIMFDEIEYISFKSPLDEHWKTEFIDFGKQFGLFKAFIGIWCSYYLVLTQVLQKSIRLMAFKIRYLVSCNRSIYMDYLKMKREL